MPTIQITTDQARHLRHVAAMGGWTTRNYFDGISDHQPVRDTLLAAGLIEARMRGRIATYELTDAGWAWCQGCAS